MLLVKNVITNKAKSLRFRKGYRSGKGDAVAVVFPTTLMAMWRVLNVLHDNNIIIIMQATNTSLTEGSVPAPGYDRSAVVVNGMKIKDLQLINNGEQVLAFPGTTLFHLENELRPLNVNHIQSLAHLIWVHRSLVVLTTILVVL